MRESRTVGLLTEADDPTYRLWPMRNAKSGGFTKLCQADPNNMSRQLPRPPTPEAVLFTSALRRMGSKLPTVAIGGYGAKETSPFTSNLTALHESFTHLIRPAQSV